MTRPAGPRAPRIPVLYLAPWVDFGGTDTGTIDWFNWIDRDRFAPYLITTQPSPNRRLAEVFPLAEEVWSLPDIVEGRHFPATILDIISSRGIQVVHVMNSRLGFNLLADIHNLPARPAIVVQLHVEEPDRSGYVRYVCTRFGNLVDGFSLTSNHLRDAVVSDYQVPVARCHVIYTGVDAAGTFNPEKVEPIEGFEKGLLHVLYPHRLEPQKDPLLMVQVSRGLTDRGVDHRIHVVGDGSLKKEVRYAAESAGVGANILFHGPTPEINRWYRASGVVLMTSVFEGVPYVIYEAMAMGVPVVAPNLPGNAELMESGGGMMIDPRDDAAAYVDALVELHENPAQGRAIGSAARTRMLDGFSLRRMAEEHEHLYSRLLKSRPAAPAPPSPVEARALRCPDRPAYATPLVSVIIPCFDHGRYLGACVESIRRQTYANTEILIVDDGSTDTETLEVLSRLHAEPGINVLRQEGNRGPSAARNLALDHAKGRYVLPVDSDNMLLPDAIEVLVAQLQSAGELVAFIYPNQQFIGNRKDYVEAPEYNLHTLLQVNYCDTCSLIDRTVFDAGVRYPEDIGVGHEDWDFALQVADLGLRGEPARSKTLLYRKHGFTRSDLVDHASEDFGRVIRRRHPELYARTEAIKGRWSPALSLITCAEVGDAPTRQRTVEALDRQTCRDAEILVWDRVDWSPPEKGVHLRRLSSDLAMAPANRIHEAALTMRGRYALLTLGGAEELVHDPAFIEKTIRLLTEWPVVLLYDIPGEGRHPLQSVTAAEVGDAAPFAVGWSLSAIPMLEPIYIHPDPMRALAANLQEWGLGAARRHHPHRVVGAETPPAEKDRASIRMDGPRGRVRSEEHEREWRMSQAALLPSAPEAATGRWSSLPTWMPPMTRTLCRHRNPRGARIVTNDRVPPHGFVLEFDLGAVGVHPLPGTTQLSAAPDPDYATIGDDPIPAGHHSLGHLELSPLPMLDPIYVATVRTTGQRVLVSGAGDDPLLSGVTELEFLGWVEPLPLRPRHGRLATNSDELYMLELERQIMALHLSVPGRIYHRVKSVPGVTAAMKRLLNRP